jgi:predicted nucleotidyltransferase
VSSLEEALRRAAGDLAAFGRPLALVGGLAVSVRTQPRFTRDIDLAVLVDADPAAEALGQQLRGRGWRPLALVEQTAQRRLATLRLAAPGAQSQGVVVDLLFASSGIEPEVVGRAEPLEVFPHLLVPVARVGHLLALKVLSRDDRRRPQDLVDLRALLEVAAPDDLALARASLRLIAQRGFARDRDLGALFDDLLSQPA